MKNPRGLVALDQIRKLHIQLSGVPGKTAEASSRLAYAVLRYMITHPVFTPTVPPRAVRRSMQFGIPLVDRLAHRAAEDMTGERFAPCSDVSADIVNEHDELTLRAHARIKSVSANYAPLLEEVDKAFQSLGLDTVNTRIPLNQVAAELPTTSSSCWPLYKKKGEEAAIIQAYNQVADWLKLQPFTCALAMHMNPCTMFHRYTSKLVPLGSRRHGVETKVRQIFGVPHSIISAEVHCFGRVLNDLSNKVYCYGTTRPELSSRLKEFDRSCRLRGHSILCGDITKMDASIPPLALILLFARLGELTGIDSLHFGLAVYHLFSPVISSTGKGHVTFGGNNSGTRLTSVINTFWLLVALRYYYRVVVGQELRDSMVLVHGDDFLLSVPSSFRVGDFERSLAQFNLTLKPNYTLVPAGGTIDFLGFRWIGYCPHQSLDWVIRKIVYPERGQIEPQWQLSLVRCASICFQVVGGSRWFDLLAEHIKPGFLAAQIAGKTDLWVELDRGKEVVKIPLSLLRSKGWKSF